MKRAQDDALAIPDPGNDFNGYLEILASLCRDEMLLEVPAGLPAIERTRRFLARAGRRYLDCEIDVQNGVFRPTILREQVRDYLDKQARRLVAMLDEERKRDTE